MVTATATEPKINKTEKVEKLGLKKAKGFLYFIDKKGNVHRIKMRAGRGPRDRAKSELVCKVGIVRVPGYLYFLDKAGDISRVRMAHGKFIVQPPSTGRK